jgi:hypothetical protein
MPAARRGASPLEGTIMVATPSTLYGVQCGCGGSKPSWRRAGRQSGRHTCGAELIPAPALTRSLATSGEGPQGKTEGRPSYARDRKPNERQHRVRASGAEAELEEGNVAT